MGLGAAILALAGCGGSTHPTTTAIGSTVSATGATRVASTPTPAAGTTSGPAAHAGGKSAGHSDPTAPSPSVRSHKTAAHQIHVGHAPLPVIKIPSPVLVCLHKSGLPHARAVEAGIWDGSSKVVGPRDVNAMVFVDGPYPTRKAADLSAQSLLGTEYATRGGHYVVSATLRSRLSAEVTLVAQCLNT